MLGNDRKCPFCEFDPVDTVTSWGFAIAFRDRYPVAEHHTLVVPRRHVVSLFALDTIKKGEVWKLAGEVRHRLADEFGVEVFTIGVNDGLLAGQTVSHAHVHVIPRVAGDSGDPLGRIR